MKLNTNVIYYGVMTDDLNSRVKQVRTTLNISQRDFAKRIFISQTLLGNIELGVRNVNDRTVQLIVNSFNVNKNWLLTGEGEMFDNQPDKTIQEMNILFNQLNPDFKRYVTAQIKNLLKLQNGEL